MCRAQTDATGSGTASGIHYLLYLRVKWQLTAAPRRDLFIPGRHIYSIVISSIRFGRCICVAVNGAKFIARGDLRSPSDWSWESVIHTEENLGGWTSARGPRFRVMTRIPYRVHYSPPPPGDGQCKEKNRILRSSWSANVHYAFEMRTNVHSRFCLAHLLRVSCKYFMRW